MCYFFSKYSANLVTKTSNTSNTETQTMIPYFFFYLFEEMFDYGSGGYCFADYCGCCDCCVFGFPFIS